MLMGFVNIWIATNCIAPAYKKTLMRSANQMLNPDLTTSKPKAMPTDR